MPPTNTVDRFNRLGRIFYIDTNFVDDPCPAAVQLRELHRDGWIELTRTDTLDTELSDTTDDAKRADLLDRSGEYVEMLGPWVIGHSRIGYMLVGSDADEERLDVVYRTLFPGSDRLDGSTERARRKLRDALHLATAWKYGCGDGFITNDRRDMIRKRDAIAARCDDLRIMYPHEALAFVMRLRTRWEIRHP